MKFLRRFIAFIRNEVDILFMTLVSELPNSGLGSRIRSIYWASRFKLPNLKLVGRGVYILSRDKIRVGRNLELGVDVTIDNNNSLGIFIGNDVVFARGVYVRTANHKFENTKALINLQGHSYKELDFRGDTYSVVIEDDVWVGANVIILSGAHISRGSVIGAGAIVTGFLPEHSVAVGNPAKVMYSRNEI